MIQQLIEAEATAQIGAGVYERTDTERRTLIQDLVDAVCFYPDQITVQVVGAPPILVTLAEVGLGQREQISGVGGGT